MEIITINWILFLKIVIVFSIGILIAYLLGRIFAKGILHEADNYVTNKFKQLKTKKQENGTEIKKEK